MENIMPKTIDQAIDYFYKVTNHATADAKLVRCGHCGGYHHVEDGYWHHVATKDVIEYDVCRECIADLPETFIYLADMSDEYNEKFEEENKVFMDARLTDWFATVPPTFKQHEISLANK
jgi:hypothetical protein